MTTHLRVAFKIALVLALCIPPTRTFAVGQETGRIIGTVVEAQSGAPVPGATMTVTGDALIGPPKVVTTNEDGRYEIENLPPGVYDVEVSYAGVKPIHRRVLVQPSLATPLEITWSPELAAVETTVVVEERHQTRPDTPDTGAVFSMEKQNNLAVARQYQSVVTQTPGITQNANGNPFVKGGPQTGNRVLIDGLDTTDPLTNTFSANINQDSLAAVQVITGGMEAKYNALGSIINLITKSGSDEYHFDISFYTRLKALQGFYTFGPQIYDGQRPYSDTPQPDTATYQANFNVGGPILKHTLWFSAGLEYDNSSSVQPAGPPLNQQAPSRVFVDYYPRLKLTWAPSGRHKFSLQGQGDPTTIDYENNAGAAANTDTPLASQGRFQGGWKALGEWDFFVSQNVDTRVFAGFSWGKTHIGPQGNVRSIDPKYGIYDFGRSRHLNNDDNTAWFNTINDRDVPRTRYQLDGSVSVRGRAAGTHDAEFGFQSSYLINRRYVKYSGGGVRYVDRQGGPLDTGLCDLDPQLGVANPTGNGCFQRIEQTDYRSRQTGYTIGLYAQDRWKPTGWLTLVPGLRWDISRAGADELADHELVYGFGPRFSAIADVTGDQKTIVQASYGRVTQMLALDAIDNVIQLTVPTATVFTFSNGAFRNPIQQTGAGSALLDTQNHIPPYADEFLLSLRRELFRNAVGTVEYTYRQVNRILETVEINQILDPAGTRVVGYVDPSKPFSIIRYGFDPRNFTRYSGIDFIFESRPIPQFDFFGSYTLGWTYGPAFDATAPGDQFGNPRQTQLFTGFAPTVDTRHNLKTQTTYNWHGFIAGVVLNWRSGIAQRKSFPTNTSVPSRYRAPPGYEPGTPINDIRSWTEFRTPDFFNVSLALRLDTYELTRQHLIFGVDLENLLNNATPTAINTADTTGAVTTFGQVATRPAPFRTQLSVRYEY